jgi:O-methyltransferase involved in polyketide biosynthesis
MEALDPARPVFFVAGGLLMYLQPDEVRGLLRALASRFPGGEMAFDVIPAWFARRSQKGAARAGDYAFPPMPWALEYPRVPELERWHPGIEVVEQRDYTQGFRERWGLIGWLARIPLLRNRRMGTLVHVRLGASRAAE